MKSDDLYGQKKAKGSGRDDETTGRVYSMMMEANENVPMRPSSKGLDSEIRLDDAWGLGVVDLRISRSNLG